MFFTSWSLALGLCTLVGLLLFRRPQRKPSGMTPCKLSPVQRYNLELLQTLARTPYDPQNTIHRDKLRLVERNFSDVLCKSTFEPDWRRLGFQRSESPITDFRALGILALDMLLTSKVFPEIQEMADTGGFPYALVLITLTFDFLNLASRDIDTGFIFPDHEAELDDLLREVAAFVDSLILDLAARLERAGGQPLLEFPSIYKEFKHARGWC